MGIGPNKEMIHNILEHSIINSNLNEQKALTIEYKYKQIESMEDYDNENKVNENDDDIENDSFTFTVEYTQKLNNPQLDVKFPKRYPYIAVGTINVKFPISEEIYVYTCFLIDINVVVTLASNLENKNKGGKAQLVKTSFSEENVKWENIHFQGEEKDGQYIKSKDNDESSNKTLDEINISSKLAVILYEDNICNEWLGVKEGKKEDFSGLDIHAIFSIKNNNYDNKIKEEEIKSKFKVTKFRKIFVENQNPFLEACEKGSDEEKELIEQSPGSPLYYRDYNGGAYVISIINENYEFQYFDKKAMLFLAKMVKKGKLLRKKTNKDIDEDNIVQLNLQRNNFGPSDIKYLGNFELKNLRILDLSNNPIKAEGVYYLSHGKKKENQFLIGWKYGFPLFSSIESLNLNSTDIGDEGLKHICNGLFPKLNSLYLSNNNITVEGIKSLVKSEFVNNLINLSLAENTKIGDSGIRIMKEQKGWSKLNILNLNYTGLTDKALIYLSEAMFPKLKILNIQGNKFSVNGRESIKAFSKKNINVHYRIEAKRIKEKERDNYIIKEKE